MRVTGGVPLSAGAAWRGFDVARPGGALWVVVAGRVVAVATGAAATVAAAAMRARGRVRGAVVRRWVRDAVARGR
jgi:hypothetical protein